MRGLKGGMALETRDWVLETGHWTLANSRLATASGCLAWLIAINRRQALTMAALRWRTIPADLLPVCILSKGAASAPKVPLKASAGTLVGDYCEAGQGTYIQSPVLDPERSLY